MSKRLFLAVIFAVLILELSVLNYFKIVGVKPNLFLIVVVMANLFFDFYWALLFSFTIGVLKDAFSVNAFGMNALIFLLLSFLIFWLAKKISIENNLVRLLVICIIVIISGIFNRLINAFGGSYLPLGIFFRVIFIELLYTVIISWLVFRLIGLSYADKAD